MEIKQGHELAGFTVEEVRAVKEHNGTAYVMRHEASGARLLYLQNEDEEMSFSIAFSTPAADDTGVFHILEHSMLCGSESYPLKKPFTAMLKSSMKTFLNAFTAADYTCYPVATTNQQDLMNLMDVYMDAVLNPLFVKDEAIFAQEGWHLEEAEDGFTFNGVVYNEMKGALSSPIRYAMSNLQAVLLPQGTYGYESGGSPAAITSLGYEAFLDVYRRHYRLDNSYIVLYGAMDIEQVLGRLDEHHLMPWVKQHAAGLDALDAPNQVVVQEPLVKLEHSCKVMGGPENAMLAFGSALAGSFDFYKTTAAGVLCDALFGNVEAPLRSLLLDSGVCKDALACNLNSGRQSHVMVLALGALEEDRARFLELISNGCRQILADGSLRELVEATVSNLEFSWRQGDSGPVGISLVQEVISCWPHCDDPLVATCYEGFLAWHEEGLQNGVYEEILKALFIDCKHAACVAFVPDEDFDPFAEQDRLAELEAREGVQALSAMAQKAACMRAQRMEPDSAQALAALPRLARDGLREEIKPAEAVRSNEAGTDIARLLVPTNGIDYVDFYFDLSSRSAEDVQYLSLLCTVVGELPAAGMSAAEVQLAMKRFLGSASCDCMQSSRWDDGEAYALLNLEFSMLASKRHEANELMWKLFSQTDFSDTDKIARVIDLVVLGYEQTLSSSAATLALSEVRKTVSRTYAVNDLIDGIESYRFYKRLQAMEDLTGVSQRLEELASWLIARRPKLVCFAGDEEGLRVACAASPCMQVSEEARELQPFAIELGERLAKGYAFPSLVAANAAVMLPAQPRRADGYDSLAELALNWDCLWDSVRVKGGAYGCSCVFDRFGNFYAVSMRDPRIDETIADFKAATQWLAEQEFTDEDVDGFVLSTIAKADKPRKPQERLTRYASLYFNGRPLEDRQRMRSQIIHATPADLHLAGERLRTYSDPVSICSLAGRDALEAASCIEEVEDLLE